MFVFMLAGTKLQPRVLGLPPREERPQKLLALLSGSVTIDNCWKIGEQVAQLVRPSIRRRLEVSLPFITGDSTLVGSLFDADQASKKSLYDIRNDIAHGNYSDHEVAFTEVVHSRLFEMKELSRKIIMEILQRVDTLSDLLS